MLIKSFDRSIRSERGMGRLLACVFATVLAVTGASAQSTEKVAINGLQDLEAFKTDAGSYLLSKNNGDSASAARLRLWLAAELAPGLMGFAVGKFEGGRASDAYSNGNSLEQAFLRYVTPGRHPVVLDAGRIVAPFGNVSTRYLSSVNPLIGLPDAYDVAYPEGIAATGRIARFDYRVAVIDRPLVNPGYVPPSDRALRPGIEAGVTPLTGLRLAAYATAGPYLGDGVTFALPPGQAWRDFDERILGIELAFSRGYFELNGEYTLSSYDVPTVADAARGRAWFVEPKYTFTPRFFAAMRLEYNDYPYILPVNSSFWVDQNAAFYDAELGVGWRCSPGLLLKASYRRDRWDPSPDPAFPFPNGYAVGLQLSYTFDVRSWFEPR